MIITNNRARSLNCPDRGAEGVHALPWLREEGREAGLQAAR